MHPGPALAGTIITLLGAAYGAGWLRLRRRARPLAGIRELALYLSGLAAIGVALTSPLHHLASTQFFAHMIQHELLLMVAPLLLLLSNPFPVILWGLPERARRVVGGWFARGAAGRLGLVALTRMEAAWLVYTATLWAWHVPAAYETALAVPLIHDLEHTTFFATGVLFWWPVAHPAPRVRPPHQYVSRIVYVVLAHLQNALLGLGLMLTPWVVYPVYAVTTRAIALSPLDDQAWGGLIMWAGGGTIHMLAVLILLGCLFGRPRTPVSRPQDAVVATH